MKKSNRIFAVVLIISITLFTAGCCKTEKGPELYAKNLMRNISEPEAKHAEISSDFKNAAFDFSADIFKKAALKNLKQAENTLISPSAALASLALSLSGASGAAKEEFSNILFPQMELSDFEMMSSSYIRSLKSSDSVSLRLLSSMWIDRTVNSSVKEDFLISNARYYGADIYKSDFTSENAVKDITEWISNRSGGVFSETGAELSENGKMYLLNALVFDGAWETSYNTNDLTVKEFENYKGENKTADFMISRGVTYLSDSYAAGFSKKYSGGKYSFVALLPNEHISINDYITVLNGEILKGVVDSGAEKTAVAQLPLFKDEFSGSLKPFLTEMGFEKIFDKSADFSGIMRKEEITYITDIFQKISFKAEPGVKKTGDKNTDLLTTVGEAVENTAEDEMIVFNRPFVYAVVDNSSSIPLLIGAVLNV